MPGLRPVVEGIDTVLMLNQSIAVSELFTAMDPDEDPITQYTFSDSGSPSSGFFIFQGIVQTNGITLTITPDELDELFYVAGPVVGNETITVRASDSTLLSDPALVKLYSARQESAQPVAAVNNVSVLGNESTLARDFISAFDPDGFPITRYSIRDRLEDKSFFSLDGETVPQGEFRSYNIDEFNRLVYNAVGRRNESIDVFAFDANGVASERGIGVVSVRANLNRPVVNFVSAITQETLLTPIAPLIDASDADGNTIKFIELRDRNDKFFSGSLVFRGDDLAPKTFHRFTPEELENVFFRGGDRSISEQVRVRVLDGRFRSSINTIRLDNVAGGGGDDDGGNAGVPTLEADNLNNNVQEQLFFQNVADLIRQTDNGFPGVTFEVLDTNPDPVSSAFVLDGVQQPGNTVLTFTDEEFERLQIRTGTFEARFFDEVYVRTNNGTFDSDWARVNMMTEPEYFEAFTRLTPLGNTVATWDDFIDPENLEPLEITFSFMQQFPNYNTGEAEENPFRMPTPRLFIPFTDAQRQWTRYLFEHIESFANVDFVEVVDSPLTVDPVSGNRGGTIRLANYYRALDPDFGGLDPSDDSITCTQVFGPSLLPEGGDIWVNVDIGTPAISPCFPLDFLNLTDLGPGTPEYRTMLDAVVTAVGEGLPFDLLGGGDQNPILPDDTSIDSFTVQGADTDPANPVSGYSLYDVNYLQTIYGPNRSFNSDDTVYSVASNLNNGGNSRETIWDGGGIDTLSAVDSIVENVVVDLRPGFFSSIGNLENNIAIGFGAEIENAIGSERNDLLIGNELDNVIVGGDGDDILQGNGGNDTLTGGASGDTFIFTIADGDNTINEMQLAGRDTIRLIELADLDSFEEDLSFRLDGRDLVIELTLDGRPTSDTTITIQDQTRGSFRIESLNIGTETVDLVNLTAQATGANQSFRLTDESTIFGNLVAPV